MSLRDQLVAKGIASRKDKRRVEQDLRKKRKGKQGERRRKRAQEEERRAREAAELEAARLERARGRRLREQEREAIEHAHRVRRIVLDNRLRHRGPVRFRFKRLDGRRIGFLDVSMRIATSLRCGELAIAAVRPVPPETEESYHVVPMKAVRKLDELEPELVVFRVTETRGIGEPDEAFLEPDWDVSLTPHRVRDQG